VKAEVKGHAASDSSASNLQHLEHRREGVVTCFVHAYRASSLAHHGNPGRTKVMLGFLAMVWQAMEKNKK